MDLIVVESPTKAKTLGRYLGSGYDVVATYGHVRDLPEKALGVDIKANFKPEFVQTVKQKERVEEIKSLSNKADKVYLATDPDREGEAIAWHVGQLIGAKTAKRIVFHEITKTAIDAAIGHPRDIDEQLVDAQIARRVLDRLVGYKLSPLLWRKIRRGLSAGRVQSVAVRLIVEREREIEAFKPEEYWNVLVKVIPVRGSWFMVQLVEKNGEKYRIGNGEEAGRAESDLRGAKYFVAAVEKKDIKKTPPAPFTTSTLQQTAANRMGWSAKKTMQVAQSLYEEGHISYHRTDSTNLADEAVRDCSEFIVRSYGKEYALERPRLFKTKSKVAQEAHEAIRPTNVQFSVDKIQFGNHDQGKLYELIWKRFVACQMAEALGTSVKVKVTAEAGNQSYGLEAKGETITFPGWLKLNDKPGDESDENEKTEEEKLPELTDGETLNFVDFTKEQKFTTPSARYNDAGLIKTLEEMGIGRPSTYAPTLTTIQDRQYVERIEKRFKPTSLGVAVNDFLMTNFAGIIDYKFTANMEDELDNIANGERAWQPVIANFYKPFEEVLESVGENSARVKVEVENTGDPCPLCSQGEIVVRIGKFGKFLACSRYPDCKYKATYLNKVGVKCPKCSDGEVIIKKTKTGKSFYGCSNYPKCDFASWTRPTPSGATEGEAKPAKPSENQDKTV